MILVNKTKLNTTGYLQCDIMASKTKADTLSEIMQGMVTECAKRGQKVFISGALEDFMSEDRGGKLVRLTVIPYTTDINAIKIAISLSAQETMEVVRINFADVTVTHHEQWDFIDDSKTEGQDESGEPVDVEEVETVEDATTDTDDVIEVDDAVVVDAEDTPAKDEDTENA